MKIRLFIANEEVELSDNLSFPLNRCFEELSNPTLILNSWSKSIEIKQTLQNMRIFGNIFNVERSFVSGADNHGLYFNPSKKTDFELLWNNQVLMSGYCKLTEVNNVSKTFTINLFGEVGNTFQEMLKCSFNDSEEMEDKYLLEEPLSSGLTLDREFVYQSFMNDEPQLSLNGCSDTDIIGFFPTSHGLNEEFDSKTFETAEGFYKFADVLDEEKEIGYGESIIGDGLTERQFGEFRSYYQKPYVYVNKLWQILCNKSKDICKFPLELDERWFNFNNPYYTKLVYVCNNMSIKGKTSDSTNVYVGDTNAVMYYRNWNWNYATHKTGRVYYDRDKSVEVINMVDYSNGVFTSNTPTTFIGNTDVKLMFSKSAPYVPQFGKKNGLVIEFKTNNGKLYKYLVVSKENSIIYNPDDYYSVIEVNEYVDDWKSEDFFSYNINIPLGWEIGAGQTFVSYDYYWLSGDKAILQTSNNIPINVDEFRVVLKSTMSVYVPYVSQRSGRKLSMSVLWNPEIKPFDVLLNYSKMLGLIFVTDYDNKKIIVTQRSLYFKDYKILDWTDKVDMSQKYTIKQPTFESKYILFNYDSFEGDKYSEYENQYRMPYGSKRLVTSYEFNSDEKKLYENINPIIVGSEYITTWKDLYYNWVPGDTISRIYNDEKYVMEEKDGKSANISNTFLFRGKNQPIELESDLFITDDTPMQINANTYTYLGSNDYEYRTMVESIPLLSYITDDSRYGCLFNLPNVSYFEPSHYDVSQATYIYDAFWRDFINERYSEHNKVITTKVMLTPVDYINFDFNRFIQIENTLYVVNRIKDYDISNSNPTEIELITLGDLNAYMKGVEFTWGVFKNHSITISEFADDSNMILIGVDANRFFDLETNDDSVRTETYTDENGNKYVKIINPKGGSVIDLIINGKIYDSLTIKP